MFTTHQSPLIARTQSQTKPQKLLRTRGPQTFLDPLPLSSTSVVALGKLPTALEAKATLWDVPKISLSHLRPMNRFGAALALLIVSAVPGSRSRRHAVLGAHVKDRANWQGHQSRPVLSKERVKAGDIGGIERCRHAAAARTSCHLSYLLQPPRHFLSAVPEPR